ncbi:MAG: hypothetical protein HKM92_03185, partial [Arenibacter sp.]|nr:hypothetical protein [Arenibacter sp.]
HIAGIGAAITGFVSTLIAIPIATYIGSFVLGTTLPLFVGFAICGIASLSIFMLMRKRSVMVRAWQRARSFR